MIEKLCALIVTYNFDESFFKCIKNIKKQVDKIIIIDNNSNKSCEKILRKITQDKTIEVIFNSENIGIAAAINKGIDYAKGLGYEWIITLDDDSIADKNMIKNIFDIYNQLNDSDIKVLCPNIYDLNIQEFCDDTLCQYKFVNKCIQSGMVINLDVFNSIEKFNEELFIYYVDDDFCENIIKNNFKILRVNNSVLNHRDGKYVKKLFLGREFNYNERSNLSIYYRARNNIYMVKKFKKIYIIENIKDLIKIIIYSGNKIQNIRFYLIGIYHGCINKYGVFKKVHNQI